MKRISKVSLIVVLGAALASAAFAQQGKKDDRGPAPAPAHSAPARVEAPRVQTAVPQRTFQVNTQQRATQPTNTQFNRKVNTGPRQISQGLPTREQVAGHQPIGVNQANGHGTGNGALGNGSRTTGNGNTNRSTGFGTTGNGNTSHNTGFGNTGNNNRNDNNNPWGNTTRGGASKIHGNTGHDTGGYRQDYQRRDNGPAFNFGFYLSSPTVDCVLSPWYAYPTLPAYLPLNEVVIQNGVNVNWDAGTNYNYLSWGNAPLTNAVDEISGIFTGQNLSYIQQVVQPSVQVSVYNNGQYEYTLQGSEFQQMLQDNTLNTHTIAFQVTNVRTDGNYATVDGAHTFNDANGNTQTVYQEYRLQNMNGSYVITNFSTSTTPL